MPAASLDGASKYLNNLLLTRGFLRDGVPIDFPGLAAPHHTTDQDDRGNADETYATTTQIINLIHDLVLRRDRDAEHREALAANIRNLQAEESQKLLDFQRLQDKHAQLRSELSTSEAQQRTLANATKQAQTETKELKEQALKMKSTLDQVRAKCISDVRRREVELDKLKNHLNNLGRGKKESIAAGMKINTLNIHQPTHAKHDRSEQVNDSKWSLESETNDFLAAVVNEISTENVALRKIVGDSMKYLRSLTGLDEQEREQEAAQKSLTNPDNAIGIPGQYRDRSIQESTSQESLVPVQDLGLSMSQVLGHCQSLLRDPSFVPIEEVQVRDEEIEKLRIGWEKMADRWKDAVTMMSQWRQKMLQDQDHSHISIEEVQSSFDVGGLSVLTAFGRSTALRPNGQPVLDPIEEEELTSMLMDHQSRNGDRSVMSHASEEPSRAHDESLAEPDETGTPRQGPMVIHEDQGEPESDLDLSEKTPLKTMASPARRGVKLQKSTPKAQSPKHRQPLSDVNTNSRKRKSDASSPSPRKRRSRSPVPESHVECHDFARTRQQPAAVALSNNISTDSIDPLHLETLTTDISDNEADEDLFTSEQVTSQSAKSKIPRMTVAQKLAAVEAEATEATEVIRIRQATTRSDDRSRRASGVEKVKTVETVKRQKTTGRDSGAMRARDKVKKARDRRRSTLTPAELGNLMGR